MLRPRSPIPQSTEERTTLSDQATPEAADAAASSTPDTPATSDTATIDTAPAGMGSFDDEGRYVPRQVTEDDLGGLSLDDAYTASMVEVEDGQIVEGTVVKVDRDEVLLDIGYKSEGVIPSRELSIRNDVDPAEVVLDDLAGHVPPLFVERAHARGLGSEGGGRARGGSGGGVGGCGGRLLGQGCALFGGRRDQAPAGLGERRGRDGTAARRRGARLARSG